MSLRLDTTVAEPEGNRLVMTRARLVAAITHYYTLPQDDNDNGECEPGETECHCLEDGRIQAEYNLFSEEETSTGEEDPSQ